MKKLGLYGLVGRKYHSDFTESKAHKNINYKIFELNMKRDYSKKLYEKLFRPLIIPLF